MSMALQVAPDGRVASLRDDDGDVRRTVEAAYARIADALARFDVESLRDICATHFTQVETSGKELSLAQVFDLLQGDVEDAASLRVAATVDAVTSHANDA